MKKLIASGLALSVFLLGCVFDDPGIVVPGCDGPNDPNHPPVCEGTGGGGSGGAGGSGGGSSGGGGGNGCGPGQVWNFGRCVAMCPNPAHLRYPNGACNYPPGAICVDVDHDYGTCRVDEAGWCVCPGN